LKHPTVDLQHESTFFQQKYINRVLDTVSYKHQPYHFHPAYHPEDGVTENMGDARKMSDMAFDGFPFDLKDNCSA
jgi:hypothetical protein